MSTLCLLVSIALCAHAAPDGVGTAALAQPSQPTLVTLPAVNSSQISTSQSDNGLNELILTELRRTMGGGPDIERLTSLIGEIQVMVPHLHQLVEQYYRWLQQQYAQKNQQVFVVIGQVTAQLGAALRLDADQQRRLAAITAPSEAFLAARHDMVVHVGPPKHRNNTQGLEARRMF